ncbi:MAG: alpha/beta hydrolase [Alphaproteobacteria bacterium]|nr:alpha/beta hydrolase [Alphaproteobacteria bacterium]
MATYLLAHGAWQGGWAWKKVAAALRASGHEVFTPTYTGLGERAHLGHSGVTLDTHIDDICGVFEAEDLTHVILAGHSYGGTVITGAAERVADRLDAMVYVDAFLPRDGESSFSRMDEGAVAAIKKAAEEKGGGWRVPPRTAEFNRIRDAADRVLYDTHVVGHPIGCMAQPIKHTNAWQKVRHLVYVHCTENTPSPFGAIAAKLKDDTAWKMHELPCGHIAMLDMPDELAEILGSVAAR